MENKINFNALELSEPTMQAIADMGFSEATPIQAQSIPLLMQGVDLIGQAQTGTGKTASFAIPAIEGTDADSRQVQTLVLCPTRELAMQVADEFEKLLKHNRKIKVLPIFGGASIQTQIMGLKRGVHIVVGTPGRILDHLDRGTLHLDTTSRIILDEADEMLDMGFREDIEAILQEMPEERQTVFFSATMSKPILELTKRYQKNPVTIKVTKNELTVAAIEQKYFDVKEKDKTALLGRLIDLVEPKLCLVFSNTKRKVDELVSELQEQGFFAEALHGDMRQATRTQVMNKFRQGVIQILVATDVAARGIDVENVEMVVNYDIPLDAEYYVHRIGRTGRAGRSGQAISFCSGSRDRSRLHDVERYAKTTIKKEPIPSLKDVELKKKTNFLTRIQHTVEQGELEKYESWVDELVNKGFEGRSIAAALIKLEIHHQIAQEDKLLNQPEPRGERERERRDSRSGERERGGRERERDGSKPRRGKQTGMARLFINLGRKNNIGPKDILGAIAGETGMEGRLIGNIDIYDKFSFVEVPEDHAHMVIKKMKKSNIRGFKVSIEVAEGKE